MSRQFDIHAAAYRAVVEARCWVADMRARRTK